LGDIALSEDTKKKILDGMVIGFKNISALGF
jgi:hypothetical protein